MIAHSVKDNGTPKNNNGNYSGPGYFFQPKLSVNQPGDVYEQEADAMADKVMRMAAPQGDTFFKPAANVLQRKCQHCEEEEKKLQRKETGNEVPSPSPQTENYIQSLSGKGRSLTPGERDFFEPTFGHDFSKVQLHTDNEAAQSAKSINAQAYTHANNIVFDAGQYQPGTDSGKKLMAHELTHVVQQKNNDNNIQRQEGALLAWKADLEQRKKKVKSIGKDGNAKLSASMDPTTNLVSGYQLTQNFVLHLDAKATPGDYALVQWVKGEVFVDKGGGKKEYWPASTGLYGKSKTDPWLFKDWIIDTPDADPRFGSHYNLAIKVPETKFEDSPGIIMKPGTGALPVGLTYDIDARMGVYPWGTHVPTTIADWEKMKPEPFAEVLWGWYVNVPPDRQSLNIRAK